VARQVFILWLNPLFHETVRLLLDDPAIKVIGDSSDYDTVRETLQRLQPDTVIFEEDNDNARACAEMFQVLEASTWELRVIRLSLLDNELKAYHREQSTVSSSEDLRRLVQEG
jgi:hypothetical protein